MTTYTFETITTAQMAGFSPSADTLTRLATMSTYRHRQ